jgi:hypothetical protein
MAYVFPTPGDIPKKIFSFPRVDFASSRFIRARISSGFGRSGSILTGDHINNLAAMRRCASIECHKPAFLAVRQLYEIRVVDLLMTKRVGVKRWDRSRGRRPEVV